MCSGGPIFATVFLDKHCIAVRHDICTRPRPHFADHIINHLPLDMRTIAFNRKRRHAGWKWRKGKTPEEIQSDNDQFYATKTGESTYKVLVRVVGHVKMLPRQLNRVGGQPALLLAVYFLNCQILLGVNYIQIKKIQKHL